MRSFLNELKRRNVFRAAAAYSVVAWVLAQAASVVLPAFDAAPWVMRTLIVLLVVGFPVALLLAWIYELTPRGLRRTDEVHGTAATAESPRTIDSIIIMGLVLAVIFSGLSRDMLTSGTQWLLENTGPPSVAESRNLPRLAVLPFLATNTDLEAERLAHGLSVDVAARLRRFEGIDVIGMDSAEYFESQKLSLKDIGSLLDADWLLEGSIRRNNGTITVNVQLQDAANGKEVLRLGYEDRRVAGLHEVRQAIEAAIAGHLELPVRGIEPADDVLAGVYPEWLTVLGRLRHGTPEDHSEVRKMTAELAERAPKAGMLHAAQAHAIVFGMDDNGTRDYSGKVAQARMLIDKAMTLTPQSLRVLQWRAEMQSRLAHWRGNPADEQRISSGIAHALELWPRDPGLLGAFARHSLDFGDYPRAAELARQALERDPLAPDLHRVLVQSLAAQGRFEEAEAVIARLQAGQAGESLTKELELRLALRKGDIGPTFELLERFAGESRAWLNEHLRVLASLGRQDEARKALESLSGPDAETWRATWNAALEGDHAEAFSLSRNVISPSMPAQAALLGKLALQAGELEAGLDMFEMHFGDWLKDAGPLRGAAALDVAPWYAYALRESGRTTDANRLLDRHLAGVLLIESDLAPVRRDLLLAANYLVQRRNDEAMAKLSASLDNGFNLTWGTYCEFSSLRDTRLLDGVRDRKEMQHLLAGLPAVHVAPRSTAGNPGRAATKGAVSY